MSLHAIDDIGDAIDATKSLLFPFAARTWLKLALVVFFIGGGGGGLNGLQNAGNFGGQDQPTGGGVDQPITDGAPPQTVDGLLAAIPAEVLVIGALVLLLVLVFGLLSNFMEFVFVQSLIEREVHVRRYLRENVGNGLRLLAFRLAVALVSLLLTVGFLYTLFATVFGGNFDNVTASALFSILPLAIVFFLTVGVVQGLLTGFTTVFVVPMMLTSDRGLVGSWKRLLGSMGSNIKQYLAYLAFSIVLGIGVGIVGSIFGLIATLLIAIPFVLVGAVAFFALGGGHVALVVVGVIAVLFALVLLLATTLIQVPLQAFLRYYAMLVLGDIDAALDPLPAVRADIRPDEVDDEPTAADGA
ncbi:DUF7544 domain-containing protein [Haloarcula onubensis]|uniref:AI-2E family transporter n=1 Tax=Haloarcula onubensis TaxID=2950539 RepID=A0ABU2FIE2_9EURY|nr:hypothetical protein [Halomicroarcula sp. S3CR25-11]MDS0280514.1 hypothetical protein [Halomicroarcula sp. S3CR25-11]